eukprot:TRINITY_DN3734_c1_g1_i1.p1 TRINITY_DN3734_c1_g1~~TRINITY_DN3734_c1_g1_i1.p1  ORF type:complete len:305 (+),score=49.30 TRINITY_DN3734_c1_g1_i1:81-995(+)
MQAEEVRYPLLGLQIAAKVWQPIEPTGILTTCIAVHGYLDNCATFDPLMPLLPASLNLKIVCIDLPGHGLSDHLPLSSSYNTPDYAYLIHALILHLGGNPVLLMGHSMGGGILAFYAGLFPENVLCFISLDSPLSYGVIEVEDKVEELLRRSLEQREQHQSRSPKVYNSLADAVDKSKSNPIYANMTMESLRIIVKRSTRPGPQEGSVVFRHDTRLLSRNTTTLNHTQVLRILTNIKAPTLQLRFDAGWVWKFDPIRIKERVAAVPKLTYIEIPGGHHLHMDDPAIVAKHCATFIRKQLDRSKL